MDHKLHVKAGNIGYKTMCGLWLGPRYFPCAGEAPTCKHCLRLVGERP